MTRIALPRATKAASFSEFRKEALRAGSPPKGGSMAAGKARKWMVSGQGAAPSRGHSRSYSTPAGTFLVVGGGRGRQGGQQAREEGRGPQVGGLALALGCPCGGQDPCEGGPAGTASGWVGA